MAMLVIDMQAGNFADPKWPIHNADALLETVRDLLQRARAGGVPVIYMQNNGGSADPDAPGTSGWRIHPMIAPQRGDTVLQKHTPDAFHNTPLQGMLAGQGVERLIVVGVQSELCVSATVAQAAALGYQVTLITNGHSTIDGETLTAAEQVQVVNRALDRVADMQPADVVVFE